jgi:PmbA protein
MAVRGVSVGVQIREGQVESSERSEGDDLGLRVFVGRRSASVSSNDPREDVAALAERAVAIARVAPEDPYARLADPADLATQWPDLDLTSIRDDRGRATSRASPAAPRRRRSPSPG